jgi:hypothetical protein
MQLAVNIKLTCLYELGVVTEKVKIISTFFNGYIKK